MQITYNKEKDVWGITEISDEEKDVIMETAVKFIVEAVGDTLAHQLINLARKNAPDELKGSMFVERVHDV